MTQARQPTDFALKEISQIQNSQGWEPLMSYSNLRWGGRKSSPESVSASASPHSASMVNKNGFSDSQSHTDASLANGGPGQQLKCVGTIGDRRHPSTSPQSTNSDSERTAVELNHTEMLLRSLSMTPDLDSSYMNRGIPMDNGSMNNGPPSNQPSPFVHGLRSFPLMSLPFIQPDANSAYLNSPSVVSSSSQLTTPSSEYHHLPVATPQDVHSPNNPSSSYFELMQGHYRDPRIGTISTSTSGGFDGDTSFSSSESSHLSGLGLALESFEAGKLGGGFPKGGDNRQGGGAPVQRRASEFEQAQHQGPRPSAPETNNPSPVFPSAPVLNHPPNPPNPPQPRLSSLPQQMQPNLDRIDLQIQSRLAELERERGNLMAFQRLRNRPSPPIQSNLQVGSSEPQNGHIGPSPSLQDPARPYNSNAILRLPSDNPLLSSMGMRNHTLLPPAQALPHRSTNDLAPRYNMPPHPLSGSRTIPSEQFQTGFIGNGDQQGTNGSDNTVTSFTPSNTTNGPRSAEPFWDNAARVKSNLPVASAAPAIPQPVGMAPQAPGIRQVSPQALNTVVDDSNRADMKYNSNAEPINYIPLLQPSSRPPYAQLVHRIIRQSDQQASIFIQQKLKSCNGTNLGDEEERALILDAILERAFEMMTNRFGNWAYQRCLEAPCNAKERRRVADSMRGRVVELATNCYGTHVVQKALECEEDVRLLILSELLLGDPATTLINKHASHVWSRIMELTWTPPAPPIFTYVNKALKGRWVELATHETGSLVVQHLFENCVEEDTIDCLSEVFAGFDTVVRDQWGSFVIQHLLENGHPDQRSRALELLGNNLYQYASDAQAMKSIEKALKVCKEEAMEMMVGRLCGLGQTGRRAMIVDLALHSNGSQLIAQILPIANDDQRKQLTNAIKRHIVTLKGNKAGSKIVWLFERMRTSQD